MCKTSELISKTLTVGYARFYLQSLSVIVTHASEFSIVIVNLWSPSRAILSSQTNSEKSVQPLDPGGNIVIVLLGLKSASTCRFGYRHCISTVYGQNVGISKFR